MDIQLLRLQPTGLHKQLVPRLVRKANDFCLDARTIPRPDTLNGPIIDRTPVQVSSDDLVGLLAGIGQIADRPVLRYLRRCRNENGITEASPGCSSIFVTSTDRALTRGGVPVLKRRMESPSAASRWLSPCAACIPSGPDETQLSPMMTVASRYVPVATMAARQRYTAPSWVTTPQTTPCSVPEYRHDHPPVLRTRFSVLFQQLCFMKAVVRPPGRPGARRECTAGPLPRFSILLCRKVASAASAHLAAQRVDFPHQVAFRRCRRWPGCRACCPPCRHWW